MNLEIISVGTELLLGDTVDTNAAYLARAVAPLGIMLYRRTTVGDNAARLRAAIDESLQRADAIVTIGGLGPTEDDLTKETVAAALGVALVEDAEHAKWLQSHAKLRNWGPLPSTYDKQATVPEHGRGIPNPNGTALGALFEAGDKIAICLPGPPNEFIPMVDGQVVPYLLQRETGAPSILRSRTLRIVGVPESMVEERVRDLLSGTNPTVAPYAKLGEVHLRVTASAADAQAADRLIEPVANSIQARLGDAIYGYDNDTLESVVVGLLRQQGKWLASAESCTGGLISKRVTDVPNASHIFGLGVVAYSNEAKVAQLRVPAELIERHGAVSLEVARAMAAGIRAVSGADIGVSTTGIAGPSGGSGEKPVGTVDVGVAWDGGVYAERRHILGGRADIAYRGSQAALELVRKLLIDATLSEGA